MDEARRQVGCKWGRLPRLPSVDVCWVIGSSWIAWVWALVLIFVIIFVLLWIRSWMVGLGWVALEVGLVLINRAFGWPYDVLGLGVGEFVAGDFCEELS
jgi:hypothetical protein